MELFLLSNSQAPGRAPLEHARAELAAFLAGAATVHFAPYALADMDGYTARTAAQLAPFGARVVGLHAVPSAAAALAEARVLFVGGGNSFRLLAALHREGLIEVVRDRVRSGALRYLGSSAGSNVACPTIRTTNDMPIVAPPELDAFGLVPFQINPHYQDTDPASRHMGETRAQRLDQFLEENDVPVAALREGAWLRRSDGRLVLGGPTGALVFRRGVPPQPYGEGADLSFLLATVPRFDAGPAAGSGGP